LAAKLLIIIQPVPTSIQQRIVAAKVL